MSVEDYIVNLEVITEIYDGSGEKQQFALQGTGQLYLIDDCFVLTYQETQEEHVTETKVTFSEYEQSVHLERTGAMKMNHTFMDGTETESVYESPYGQFQYVSKNAMVEYVIDDLDRQVWTLEFELYLDQNFMGEYRIIHRVGNVSNPEDEGQIH